MKELIIPFAVFIVCAVIIFVVRRIIHNQSESEKEKSTDSEAKRLAQNKLNTQAILGIIKNDASKPGDLMLSHYEIVFDKWQETQFNMVKHASLKSKEIFFSLEAGNDPYVCHAVYSADAPGNDYELLMADCFTEPFYSGHDMDDYAIWQFIWQILLLKGIDEESSRDIYFFQKAHFVNHSIAQAIIVVDVYEKS